MDEGAIGSVGEPSSSSRTKPSFVKLGDRQVFTVELRPGETTFVSWKKLVKDANKVNSAGSGGGGDCVEPTLIAPIPIPAAPDPTSVSTHPGLETHIAPGQPDENEAKDAPLANRFSAVIEKIERLYMGKDSSDEEELKDVPDDDQYDTEDSFIDDAELDEYFEVDNSEIKHDGFFVNRGKLERIEPTAVPNQQPKKRRRKDVMKTLVEGSGHVSNKHVKAGKLVVAKTSHGVPGLSQNLVLANEHYEDVKSQHPSNATSSHLKKKSAEARMNLDMPSSVKVSNGSDPMSLAESMDHERPKTANLQAKQTSRPKDSSRSSDVMHQKNQDRSNHTQSKLQSAKPVNSINEVETSLRSKEKNGVRELPDLNSYPDSKVSMPVTTNILQKTTHIHKRDGSSIRPKNSMLEKSIRELEKMVAESRPPMLGSQDTEVSSQTIKRRLPQDIKLKLAQVARLAGREGRMSKELINRLMSILGHLIQLRTLKRNMKDMIRMGMRAKEENDDRFQQIKKEVVEMIKTRVHSLDLKALEQQAGASDDFWELGYEEKRSQKQKFSMDAVLEDKICDLYDLFVDGMDEDTGPQVRKLYAELAGLWPTGFMDNHGIKRAICQAKERQRAMSTRYKDRVASDSGGPVLALASKLIPGPSTSTVRSSSPSTNPPSLDRQKQKPRVSSSSPVDEPKMGVDVALPKKKVKRKPEQDIDESLFCTNKLYSQSNEERNKSLKHISGLPEKLNIQSTTVQVSNSVADFVESK